jgi:hypothetical protein
MLNDNAITLTLHELGLYKQINEFSDSRPWRRDRKKKKSIPKLELVTATKPPVKLRLILKDSRIKIKATLNLS